MPCRRRSIGRKEAQHVPLSNLCAPDKGYSSPSICGRPLRAERMAECKWFSRSFSTAWEEARRRGGQTLSTVGALSAFAFCLSNNETTRGSTAARRSPPSLTEEVVKRYVQGEAPRGRGARASVGVTNRSNIWLSPCKKVTSCAKPRVVAGRVERTSMPTAGFLDLPSFGATVDHRAGAGGSAQQRGEQRHHARFSSETGPALRAVSTGADSAPRGVDRPRPQVPQWPAACSCELGSGAGPRETSFRMAAKKSQHWTNFLSVCGQTLNFWRPHPS